jgi:hypothetical protein
VGSAVLLGLGSGQIRAQESTDSSVEPDADKFLQLKDLAGDAELWKMTSAEFDKVYIRPKRGDKDKGQPGGVRIIRVVPADEMDDESAKSGTETRVFEWLSAAKNAARYQGTTSSFKVVDRKMVRGKNQARLGAVDIGETIVRFDDDKVRVVEFSIFNRGDDGEIRQELFEGKLKKVAEFVSARSGARMEVPRNRTSGAVRAQRKIWRGKEAYYQLEYSFQRNVGGKSFLPEFIKLKSAPASAGGIMAGAAKSKLADRRSLRDRVTKREGGDVLMEGVPMVDQGAKGYCAVASAERVLRYYGIEVDQHEMAQLAGSSAFGGTSAKKMKEALESAAGRLKVRVRTHYEAFEEYDEYERLIKRYNRVAKKNPEAKIFEKRDGWRWYYETLYRTGDPESLKAVLADGSKYGRFKKDVYEQVDAGVPLLWSLFLGVFPEKDIPQASGGHMRLIIGYNRAKDELIYSDSWGAGHEEKRMPFDEAFTMTLGLRMLVPSR